MADVKRRPPPPPPPIKPKPCIRPRTQTNRGQGKVAAAQDQPRVPGASDASHAKFVHTASNTSRSSAPVNTGAQQTKPAAEFYAEVSLPLQTQCVDNLKTADNGKNPNPYGSMDACEADYCKRTKFAVSTTSMNPYLATRQSSFALSTTSSASGYDDSFIEMLTLQGDGETSHIEWHEAARWIKFEENFETVAGRWSQPHVASLSYRALSDMRAMFSEGEALLLDIPVGACFNYHSVVMSLSDQLHAVGSLTNRSARAFRDTLMSPIVHHEKLAKQHKPLTTVSSFLRRRTSSRNAGMSTIRQLRPRPAVTRALSLGNNPNSSREHPALRRSSTDAAAYSCTSPQNAAALGTGQTHLPLVVEGQVSPASSSDVMDDALLGTTRLTFTNDSHNMGGSSDGSTEASRRGSEDHLMQPCRSSVMLSCHQITPVQDEILRTLPADAEAGCVLVASVDFVTKPLVCIARLAMPYFMGDLVEVPLPTSTIAVCFTPRSSSSARRDHEVGRTLATLLSNQQFREKLDIAASPADVAAFIEDFLDATIVLQQGVYDDTLLLPALKNCLPATAECLATAAVERHHHGTTLRSGQHAGIGQEKSIRPGAPDRGDDPLLKTGRLFGGLVQDFSRLRRRYVSDFRDALSVQCVTTILVMYFGLIAPLIAFGSLLGEKTHGMLGLAETLVSASFGGVIFSLLAGQPLMFISVTGPMALFEVAIYSFCLDHDIHFFAFRFWTGMWIFICLAVIVATDSSHLIRRFTPFTEEVFTALIAFIFIFESTSTIFRVFQQHPLEKVYECSAAQCRNTSSHLLSSFLDNNTNCSADIGHLPGNASIAGQEWIEARLLPLDTSLNQPNTALFYLMLVFGTFSLAYVLRSLKTSRYMSKYSRRFFSDMGVFLSILAMYLISRYIFHEVHNEKIAVPIGIKTTHPRPWLIDPRPAMTPALVFGAAIPGLLAAFLIFMETQVTCLLCCSAEHRLKKTGGYHLNLAVTAVLSLVCSVLGLPWLCGQPVTSVIHAKSLLKVNTRVAPGEKPQIEGLHEQRVTGLVISALVGVSLTSPIASALSHIPMGVVMGIFFYMGFCNLQSLQFTKRVILLFVPSKHHPSYAPQHSFIKAVSATRMHIFTLIQLICFSVLVVCKITKASLVFPLFVALMIPVRDYLLPKWLSARELAALDPH